MGLLLFFLPKFPRAIFIQGAMFILDSRVGTKYYNITFSFGNRGNTILCHSPEFIEELNESVLPM